MPNFLDEINGGFVVYTRGKSEIDEIVGTNVYPEVAPQGTRVPHIIYHLAAGSRIKSHAGVDGCRNIVLHVYAIGESQPQANTLAKLIEDRWLSADNAIAAGATIQVCNGGIADQGQWFPQESSDIHMFHVRVILRMLISE